MQRDTVIREPLCDASLLHSPRIPTSSAGAIRSERNAIFVLGPSSSGKSTLCEALAKNLCLNDKSYIKEVARHVMKTQGFDRNNTGTYEMQHAIMAAQLQAEVDVLRHADVASGDVILLSDRSAVDPIVYASTANLATAKETRSRLIENHAFRAALPVYRKSVFVVLHPVKEWIVDDGIRSLEDPWKYLEELSRTLQELGIPYVELGENIKDLLERVAFVKSLLSRVVGLEQGRE